MLLKKYTYYLSLLITLIVLTLAIYLTKWNIQGVNDIVEREKCPACFGLDLCQDISDHRISLEYNDFYSIFNNLLGVKNVYYGRYGETRVVIKKLAHNNELDSFDKIICDYREFKELCSEGPNESLKQNTDFYDLILTELNDSDMNDPDTKLRLCPTTTNLQKLFSNVLTEKNLKNQDFYKFLWSSIKINPEPIIFQILSSDDDWPTPKYFGACGRVIVEEFVGLPLSAFIQETWIKRAKIASSLLDAAYKFTFRNSKFAFYLTDISMDNIAVNNENKAIFIDLEHIIIVDKYPPIEVIEGKTLWNKTYINDAYTDCSDCFTFSPSDICSHRISDHNYYGICQHIFVQGLDTNSRSQGFLHNIPDSISQQYPDFLHLLRQCSRPEEYHSRIQYGVKLKEVLDTIIKNIK